MSGPLALRRDPRGDPLFDLVRLLILGNDKIVDESISRRTLTIGGSTAIKPVQKLQTGSAIWFDRSGSTDVIQCQTPVVGTTDYCFECYVLIDAYPPGPDAPNDLYKLWKGSQTSPYFSHEIKYNGLWSLFLGGVGYYQHPTPVPLKVPVHLAISREKTTFRLFVQGYLGLQATGINPSLPSGVSDIGGDSGVGSGRSVAGAMRDIRITVGHPRYTRDFTPPPPGFDSFGPLSWPSPTLPQWISEPEPEPELEPGESCAAIPTGGLGNTRVPYLVTRGLGLCPGVLPPAPSPAPPPMTLYYEPEKPDRSVHLRRQILREDQLILDAILLAVTRVLR